jgi:hypothetical protein
VSAPLSIQVIAQRFDAPVRVSLHRQSWAVVEAEGSTGGSGTYRFDGRAYGDVGIRLSSAAGKPTRATVLLWMGDPVPPPLQTVYVPPGSARALAAGTASAGVAAAGAAAGAARAPVEAGAVAGSAAPAAPAGTGTSPVTIGILVMLVVIAALLAVLVLRKGGSKSAAVWLAALLVPAFAGGADAARAQAPNPFDVPKAMQKPPLDADKTPRGPKDAPKDSPPKPDPVPNPFDVDDKDWKPSPRDPAIDAPKDDEPAAEEGTPEGDGADSYRERIAAAEQHARDLSAQVANNRAEIERLRMLLESDRESETDPDNIPPVPLSCRPPLRGGDGILAAGEGDREWANFEECQKCYREPLRRFEDQLQLYERLRILYSDTSKFVTKVISVGDQAPKPHYLLENAWAAQKTKIRVDFAKTQQAYDAKLAEFNGKLGGILDEIGECETTLNNNPMWRATSGTFFHQTMANSYKRTD